MKSSVNSQTVLLKFLLKKVVNKVISSSTKAKQKVMDNPAEVQNGVWGGYKFPRTNLIQNLNSFQNWPKVVSIL